MAAGLHRHVNYFEDDDYDVLANLHHDINTRGRWRFLPRSALMFDAGYSFVRYSDDQAQQTDGDSVRAKIGYQGLVTYHLSVMGAVGWASSYYEPRAGGLEARQFDSLIANAEVRWFIHRSRTFRTRPSRAACPRLPSAIRARSPTATTALFTSVTAATRSSSMYLLARSSQGSRWASARRLPKWK